jgi:hypothetical protein
VKNLREELKPTQPLPVQQLVEAAGIDVSSWSKNQRGELIEENQNVYKNFLWAFGGGSDPIALCIWHREVDWDSDPPVRAGNIKQQQSEFNALADKDTAPAVKRRLGIKIRRSREVEKRISEAYRGGKPIRFILLEGDRVSGERAAVDSSTVHARLLDPEKWYVHSFNPFTGEFRMVRGVPSTKPATPDPFEGLEDPADDPAFQALIAPLKDTEKEALIKARVGQGAFRAGLIKRWKGCSVTTCGVVDTLIASHIKPWSLCETIAERLGDSNGLLLLPNLDMAFELGLISFDDKFRMVVSPRLAPGHRLQLGVDEGKRLAAAAGPDLVPQLHWHRENRFKAW